jgi:hypothetical protein
MSIDFAVVCSRSRPREWKDATEADPEGFSEANDWSKL